MRPSVSAVVVSASVAFAAGCAAIGGLGDYKEVECVGAGCADGSILGADASSGGDATTDGGGGEVLDFVTIGGNLSGLTGKGLILANNGSDDLQVATNGAFVFPAKVRTGDPYAVTVKAPPSEPTQACTVANGSGTANGANITNVNVTCATSAFSIGGSVVGLSSGSVTLSNGGEDLVVSANGAFTFVNKVASGATFDVTVKSGNCTVSGGSGTVGVSDVTSIVVNCAPGTYTVGGTITGLNGTVVLQNNATNDTTLTSNGGFAFTTTLTPGQPYAVTVKTQPSYPPRSQTCTVTNGTGNIVSSNVTNVAVACVTNTFKVGGNVSGLTGTLVLKNNGGNDLTVNANGAFEFSTMIASGSTYAVTIATQPAGQTCTIAAGSGTVTNGAITNVAISCSGSMTDQGITCAGGTYCNPATQECCKTPSTVSCVTKCTGGDTTRLVCDSALDCAAAGVPNGVCCGSVFNNVVLGTFCTQASNCEMGSGKAYFCNPNVATPCPQGGTCTATNEPLPGYYRCY